MTRSKIEAMKYVGEGWDADLPDLIADSFWKKYEDVDGTGYAVLNKKEQYKVGCTERGEPWSDWKDLNATI